MPGAQPERKPVVLHYPIDPEIHRRAKRAALELDITLKRFVEEALDEKARTVERAEARKKPRKRHR